MLTGPAKAALDTAFPAYLLNKVTKRFAGEVAKEFEPKWRDGWTGYVDRFAKGTIQGSPIEGSTEGIQQALDIAAQRYAEFHDHPDKLYAPLNHEEWKSIIDSAFAGGIGGVAGGVVEVATARKPTAKESSVVQPEAKPTVKESLPVQPEAAPINPPPSPVLTAPVNTVEEKAAVNLAVKQDGIKQLYDRWKAGDKTTETEIAALSEPEKALFDQFVKNGTETPTPTPPVQSESVASPPGENAVSSETTPAKRAPITATDSGIGQVPDTTDVTSPVDEAILARKNETKTPSVAPTAPAPVAPEPAPTVSPDQAEAAKLKADNERLAANLEAKTKAEESAQSVTAGHVDYAYGTESEAEETGKKRTKYPGYFVVGEDNAPAQVLKGATQTYRDANTESEKEVAAKAIGKVLASQANPRESRALTNRVTIWKNRETGEALLSGTFQRGLTENVKPGVTTDDNYRFDTRLGVKQRGKNETTTGLRSMLDSGWDPVGSMRLAKPQKQVVRRIPSMELFEAEFGHLAEQRDEVFGAQADTIANQAQATITYSEDGQIATVDIWDNSARGDTAMQEDEAALFKGWTEANVPLTEKIGKWLAENPKATPGSLIATFFDELKGSVREFTDDPVEQAKLSELIGEEINDLLNRHANQSARTAVDTKPAATGQGQNPTGNLGNSKGAGQNTTAKPDQTQVDWASKPKHIVDAKASVEAMLADGTITEEDAEVAREDLAMDGFDADDADYLIATLAKKTEPKPHTMVDPSAPPEIAGGQFIQPELLPVSPEAIASNIRNRAANPGLIMPDSPLGLLGSMNWEFIREKFKTMRDGLLFIAREFATRQNPTRFEILQATFAKALADKMEASGTVLRIDSDPLSTSMGYYDLYRNEAHLNPALHRTEGDLYQTHLHEGFHSFADRLLMRAQQDPKSLEPWEMEFASKLNLLAKDMLAAGLTWQNSKGDPSVAVSEFLAHALTDKAFQEQLSQMPVPAKYGIVGAKNLWQAVKQLFGRLVEGLLGRFPEIFGSNNPSKISAADAAEQLIGLLLNHYSEKTAFKDNAWSSAQLMKVNQAGVAPGASAMRYRRTTGHEEDLSPGYRRQNEINASRMMAVVNFAIDTKADWVNALNAAWASNPTTDPAIMDERAKTMQVVERAFDKHLGNMEENKAAILKNLQDVGNDPISDTIRLDNLGVFGSEAYTRIHGGGCGL